jgi:hypothetical protein
VRGPAALLGIASNQTNFRAAVADRRFPPEGMGRAFVGARADDIAIYGRRGQVLLVDVALPLRPSTDVREGAAMIARGNVLNRMTLPEVPKPPAADGVLCSGTSKTREPPENTRAASLTVGSCL